MTITHYDLFAGIGGFSLALEEVYKDAAIKHIFCEWESFPTAVLKQHWPDGEFWGDIAELVTDTEGKRMERQRWSEQEDSEHNGRHQFTIVTGGFPCQPFSHAGRRKGTADDRYQWPNMLAVIRNTKPEWVIAENVRGLVTWNDGLVLETVCTDLEAEGYEVQPFIIPAVAVGAPHRRDRVWIIANARSEESGKLPSGKRQTIPKTRETNPTYPNWRCNWQEVAFATCNDTVDDGLSRLVDGVPYSRPKWRKDSLKAYGNGIVPEVAMQIVRAIRQANEGVL